MNSTLDQSIPAQTGYSQYAASRTSPEALPELVAGPYAELAVFACVMLLACFVLVVFMRPGNMARLIAGIPFSLFILALIAIPLQAMAGFHLIDFSMAEAPSPLLSALRLGAEILCYAAAWQCIPWLYIGKERLIDFIVRKLTKR